MVIPRFMPGVSTNLRQPSNLICKAGEHLLTSEERREARYQRRRHRRAEAKAARNRYATYDQVFSYGNLYRAYKLCRRNVAWKASVQKYIVQAPVLVYKTWAQLSMGKYKPPVFFEFDIRERGKARHIRSTTITDRVVQRSLCDNALVPTVFGTMIYDTGACVKDKGYTFAVERMDAHLQKFIRKYGTDGAILMGDFRHFFDSIMHWAVLKVLHNELEDLRVIGMTENLIRMFDAKKSPERRRGLGLGSQISQVLAPAVASYIDHFIKSVPGAKYYARYNDDFYVIGKSKAWLHRLKELIRAKCAETGLELHPRKTQVVKLTHGFQWLKVKYTVTPTGKIIHRLHRSSVTRERRKLKSLAARYHAGERTFKQFFDSWQCWDAHAARFQSRKTRNEMEILFVKLLIGGDDHAVVQAA